MDRAFSSTFTEEVKRERQILLKIKLRMIPEALCLQFLSRRRPQINLREDASSVTLLFTGITKCNKGSALMFFFFKFYATAFHLLITIPRLSLPFSIL